MAATFFWSDHKFTGTIASKAKNNTGISNVTVETPTDMFVGSVVNPTEGSYTSTDVSNKTAGSEANSAFSFYLGISSTAGTSVSGVVSSKVLWAGKSTYSDAHTVEIGIKRAATAVTLSTTAATLYSDGLGKLQYETSTADGKTAYTNASYTDATFATNGVTIGADETITLAENVFATSGTATVSVAATWAEGKLADGQIISNTVEFTVKNAVKDVVIDNKTTAKTIYVAVGSDASFSYTVVPEQKGIACSYTLIPTLSGGAVDAIKVTSQTAPTKAAAGTWAITGETVGVYTVNFKSTETSDGDGKTSPTVTIVVTPASMTYAINCGDTVTIAANTIPTGTKITLGENSDISSTAAASGATGVVATMTGLDADNKVKADTPIVIYAASATMGTATWAIDGGSTITVQVSHLSVTLD